MNYRVILVLTYSTYLNETELSKVSGGIMVNKIKLNLDKTRSMLLHQSKNSFLKNTDLNINIGKTFIKKANGYKYLGVFIVRNLNWTEHIETIKTIFKAETHQNSLCNDKLF